jgi:hypothetical protein
LGALCGRTQLALDGFDAEGGLGWDIPLRYGKIGGFNMGISMEIYGNIE